MASCYFDDTIDVIESEAVELTDSTCKIWLNESLIFLKKFVTFWENFCNFLRGVVSYTEFKAYHADQYQGRSGQVPGAT